MKRLKLLLVFLLSISLSACSEKAENLEQLYYPFSGDIYPYPHAEVDDPDDLKDQPWNIQNLKKLKALPIYTYDFLSDDEMIKKADEIAAGYGLTANNITHNFGDNIPKNIILSNDGDDQTLYFYDNGSYTLKFFKPRIVCDQTYTENDLKNEAFIQQIAMDTYQQMLSVQIPYNDPQLRIEYHTGFRSKTEASVTLQENAADELSKQLNAAYNTVTLSFNEVGLTEITYHAPADVLVGKTRLLSAEEAIEQLKSFGNDNERLAMPKNVEIRDGRLFYCNAFNLKETIPVYQLYYTSSENPNTLEMLVPAVYLDLDNLNVPKYEQETAKMAYDAFNTTPISIQQPLPDDLTTIRLNDDIKLSYTAVGGIGAAGGGSVFYTEKQMEAIKNSRWNLTNFTDEDLFPIYHKASLSKEEMQSMADVICQSFNVSINSIDYYEPVDFHADDFVLEDSHRYDSTQKSLSVDTDLFYLRISEHGSVLLYLDLAYSDTDTPYSKNPESDLKGYIDKASDSEKNIAFYKREAMMAYDKILKNIWAFNDPLVDVQEISESNIATNNQLDYSTKLVENMSDGTLAQQLFAARYQQLTYAYMEDGMWYVIYTPILGIKTCDMPLISVEDAIAQYREMMAIPPEIDEILTVTVDYNNADYLYDTIPVYNIYYWKDDRIVCSTMPAVTIDSDLYYIAPNIIYELHMEDAFHQ